jgi:8-oxo-dGTP pyrophosphatase MutT (NUDIX family)
MKSRGVADQSAQVEQSLIPKKCLIASGCLIHGNRVLLVKHKKLGHWLNPGGHVDPNEPLHAAAEREFWEETGVKVKACQIIEKNEDPEVLPVPFFSSLTWVSENNYQSRVDGRPKSADNPWKRGCEQHLYFNFLVEAVGDVQPVQNLEETDGIEFFTREQVTTLEMPEMIKKEVYLAFQLYEKISSN